MCQFVEPNFKWRRASLLGRGARAWPSWWSWRWRRLVGRGQVRQKRGKHCPSHFRASSQQIRTLCTIFEELDYSEQDSENTEKDSNITGHILEISVNSWHIRKMEPQKSFLEMFCFQFLDECLKKRNHHDDHHHHHHFLNHGHDGCFPQHKVIQPSATLSGSPA